MKLLRKESREQTSIFYSEDYGFLGHLLYSERLRQNISLKTVTVDLNLSTYIINNLETGYLHRTPGVAYMLGFMRTYATYLGLDSQEMIRYVHPPSHTFFEEESVLKVSLQQRQLPNNLLLWGSVVGLVLVIITYIFLRSDSGSALHMVKLNKDLIVPSPSKDAPYSENLLTSINQFFNIYRKPFTADTRLKNSLKTSQNSFFIMCKEDSWIMLKNSRGKIIRSGILQRGEHITLSEDFDGILHTGNAGGIYIQYDSKIFPAIGASGSVIQNYRLNLKSILLNQPNSSLSTIHQH